MPEKPSVAENKALQEKVRALQWARSVSVTFCFKNEDLGWYASVLTCMVYVLREHCEQSCRRRADGGYENETVRNDEGCETIGVSKRKVLSLDAGGRAKMGFDWHRSDLCCFRCMWVGSRNGFVKGRRYDPFSQPISSDLVHKHFALLLLVGLCGKMRVSWHSWLSSCCLLCEWKGSKRSVCSRCDGNMRCEERGRM